MILVINQPNYLPWKGYFDLIDRADIFVWYDDVQYTKNDWRNRNKIKTPYGIKWITVPVDNSIHKLVNQTKIDYRSNWIRKQLQLIYDSYHRCPFFEDIYQILRQSLNSKYDTISELDISLNQAICQYIGINTRFVKSSDYNFEGSNEERVLNICKFFGADIYLSGPAGNNYLNLEKFKKEYIYIEFIKYSYEKYEQPHGPFDHYVSIIDTIACLGKDTINYIRASRQ